MTDASVPDPTPAEPADPDTSARPEAALAPPPANAGWAVASLLFFWPLAFSAFTHAFNVYPLWAVGDVASARHASDRVRRVGQLSLWLAGGLLLLLAIGYTIVAVVLITHGDVETPRHGVERGDEFFRDFRR
ncbi:MAG: CD225/dispanin family protein [Mycobacterium sp.]